LLGTGLNAAGNTALAESVFRSAQRRYPRDVWVNYELGSLLETHSRRDDAIRFYTAARAIRPETAHELAHVLSARGESDEAIEIYRELARLRPNDGRHLVCLAVDLKGRGRSQEAAAALEQSVAVFREAIRNKPDDFAAHGNLGRALASQGKRDLAVAEFREAIRVNPNLATLHCDLGLALSSLGQGDLAASEFREAIRLNADYAEPHSWLGNILMSQGKLDLALAEYREAVRINPDNALAYDCLGGGLEAQGQFDQAITAYRNAIRVKPDFAIAHNNLGFLLARQKKLDLAEAEFREAIRLQPNHAQAHYNLGLALELRGKHDEAVAKYREAIQFEPDYAEAHCNLGLSLLRLGKHAESLSFLRRGHELGTKRSGWSYPSAQWVAQAERLARMTDRLPALIKGQESPKDIPERMELAQICYGRKYFTAAARFWAGALKADPRLGDDLRAGHRYNAACAAALAGSGEGADDPPPDEEAKTGFRTQARDWLGADLALHAKQIGTGTASARAAVVPVLEQWKRDSDLAGIRDADRLAKLPATEQSVWRTLWADVDALLKPAARPKAIEAKKLGR
jgi:eukaryotic-like serine/threonine-protein kinase